MGGWTADASATVSYRLTIDLVGQQDNAPPLVDGPAPLLQIHLDGMTSTVGAGINGRFRRRSKRGLLGVVAGAIQSWFPAK